MVKKIVHTTSRFKIFCAIRSRKFILSKPITMNGHDNILCYYILLQLKTFSNFIPNNNNNVDDFVKSEEIKKKQCCSTVCGKHEDLSWSFDWLAGIDEILLVTLLYYAYKADSLLNMSNKVE